MTKKDKIKIQRAIRKEINQLKSYHDSNFIGWIRGLKIAIKIVGKMPIDHS